MIIHKRAIPDTLRGVGVHPSVHRGGQGAFGNRSPTTRGPMASSAGDVATNRTNLAQYAYKPVSKGGTSKYTRVAPVDAPEWYGMTEDEALINIWERLDFRDGHKHRRLSKQMRRVCTRALEKKLKLSPEQAVAFADAMAGRNVFLTGGAGVGKSHTLTQIVKHLTPETYAFTASTGCAAAIVGASTLHSTLGIGLATQPAKTYAIKIKKNNPIVFQRVRRIRTLILDECSMLDGLTFNKAGLVVGMLKQDWQHYSEDYMSKLENFKLWQDMQIICCGDFMQLPPVQVKDNGWIFASRAWKELKFHNHVLSMIHRQAGDPTFAEVLARARIGKATSADVAYLCENAAQEDPENGLKLFATNKPADDLNQQRFQQLVDAGNMPHAFTAIDWADKPQYLEKLANCQVAHKLWLSNGARVMCLRNLIDGKLVNGSVGTVVSIRPFRDLVVDKIVGATIEVKFDGMMGDDSFTHTFRTYESCMPEAQVAREFEFTVMEGKKKIASRIQIPLRLAWAVSIHKSQGMSLERASIDFNRVFENGQAYTALSRMRTLAGAFLKGLQLRHLLMVSDKARDWYTGLRVEEWERV